ncbi:MAG: response regulator, partial [Planctomycetaceae bacterium]|nr:response regulator [Planctomycetaceae bacterium]
MFFCVFYLCSSVSICGPLSFRAKEGVFVSGQTILVVDDEPSIVEIVTLYLQRAGYTVRSAADGHAALRALTAEKPDLVV